MRGLILLFILISLMPFQASYSSGFDPVNSVAIRNSKDINGKITKIRVRQPKQATRDNTYTISQIDPMTSFKTAIEAIKLKAQPSKIVFENAPYNIEDPLAGHIFTIKGIRDLQVDCRGAVLNIKAERVVFWIEHSQNIRIQNCTIRYDSESQSIASSGRVVKNKGQLEIQVDSKYFSRYDKSDYYKRVSSLYELSANPNNPWKKFSRYRWVPSLAEASFSYDAQRRRFTTTNQAVLEPFLSGNKKVMIRHADYEANAFNVVNCRNVSFLRNTLSNVPGMGFFIRRVPAGVLVSNNVIEKDPNDAHALISASADALHLNSVANQIIIEGNNFSYHSDDSINIHSNYWQLDEIKDSTHIVIRPERNYYLPSKLNEELVFYRKNLTEFSKAKVKSWKRTSEFRLEIELDKPILNLNTSLIVHRPLWQGNNILINNNRFTKQWARGILIQAKNAYVTRNTLEDISGAAILISTDYNDFRENGPSENILIENNRINRVADSIMSQAPRSLAFGAISINSLINEELGSYSKNKLHSNISIMNNFINRVPGPALAVGSSKQVKLENNRIRNANYIDYDLYKAGSFHGLNPEAQDVFMY